VPEPQSAEELYNLDPSDFTAARNTLVKRLRGAGNADEAARVSKLRRPSSTAWALNQVARQQQELIESFLNSGRRLREATTSALGGDRSGLAEARATEREAIEPVVEAAVQRIGDAGMSAGDEQRRRVAETLRSATVDEDVAALLVRGVLDADKESVGFDFSPILALPKGAKRPPTKRGPTTQTAAPRGDAMARKRLATQVGQLRERARDARRAADEASKTAVRLAGQAAAADAELVRAEQRLEGGSRS
jgi:hypothetical protein